jgi:hypothetical protein
VSPLYTSEKHQVPDNVGVNEGDVACAVSPAPEVTGRVARWFDARVLQGAGVSVWVLAVWQTKNPRLPVGVPPLTLPLTVPVLLSVAE